jgi:xanthine dehydrogenase accessory factor
VGRAAVEGGDRIGDDLIPLLADHAATGTPCVLATVVGCEPPTSARPGDKAVITPDGRLRGWVGGSCSEPLVRREALRALAEGTPRLVRIVAAAAVEEARRPGELTLATTCPGGGSMEIFVEPRLPRPLLLVFGASPAARTLLALAAHLGFRTCAVHPGARPEDFPAADLVLPGLDLAPAAPGADAWAVVATMGHYDEDALEAALAYPDVRVALVASARRGAAVRDALRTRGVDETSLERIRSPAGATRAPGQEEIALFALAELVAERRERRAGAGGGAAGAERFATDPVCGMAVEVAASAWRATHGGGTLHFCSAACRDRYLAEHAVRSEPAS